MTTSTDERLEAIKQSSDENLQNLAAVYYELLSGMNETVETARKVVDKLPTTVAGVKELTSLLQIMDGSFIRVATGVIQDAAANRAANANDEDPTEDLPE